MSRAMDDCYKFYGEGTCLTTLFNDDYFWLK